MQTSFIFAEFIREPPLDVFLHRSVFVVMQHPCVAVKPLAVQITTPVALLSAGKTQELHCEASGSVPPARVTWLLDGEPLRSASTSVCSSCVVSLLTGFDSWTAGHCTQ